MTNRGLVHKTRHVQYKHVGNGKIFQISSKKSYGDAQSKIKPIIQNWIKDGMPL